MTKETFNKLSNMEMDLADILDIELDEKNYSDLREAYMKIAIVVRRNEFRFTTQKSRFK